MVTAVSNPLPRLRAFDQIPASRTRGVEKRGRIGKVKKRKERGKGREVNKVSCSLAGWGTLPSCPSKEETRDKMIPVAATESGASAGKLVPEYPEWSGCQFQWRRVPPEWPFVAGRATPSRAQTGLWSNTWKWIVWGDTCADKARNFIGKRAPGWKAIG